MKESDLMRRIQLRATELGARLWRNNVGTYKTKEGYWIKYGIQNPGGSDLIGFTPITITTSMVGSKLAVFTAIEVKTLRGKASEDQEAFIDCVKLNGGIASLARNEGELDGLIQMPNMQAGVQGRAENTT